MNNQRIVKSVKYNFLMNALLTMSSFLFPLITFPYISRILLPEGVGKVYFANSVISYFSMLAQLGIPTYGIRACAKVRDNKNELSRTVQEISIINLVTTSISYTLFFCALAAVPRLRQDKLLFIIASLSMIFNTIGIEWLYKGLEQYSYITIRFIIAKIIALLALFALVHTEKDYVIYCGISIFAGGASFIFNFFHARHLVQFRPVGRYHFRRHFKPIVIFFAMACATTIYTNFDNVMLGFIQTDTSVGYYNAAVKIKTILAGIVTSLGTVLLPRASYYIEQNMKREFMRISKKALHFVLLLATPFGIYFMLFAKESIFFLSGTSYSSSILPMQIIMPTLLLIGLTNIMGIQMLVPLGQEKTVLYSQIMGAGVNLAINWVLIPCLSSVGAAIGTLAAEFTVWLVQYVRMHDTLNSIYRSIDYLPIIVAVSLAGLASLWTKMLPLDNFFVLSISAVFYFIIYMTVLTLFKEPLILEIEQQMKNKFFRRD